MCYFSSYPYAPLSNSEWRNLGWIYSNIEHPEIYANRVDFRMKAEKRQSWASWWGGKDEFNRLRQVITDDTLVKWRKTCEYLIGRTFRLCMRDKLSKWPVQRYAWYSSLNDIASQPNRSENGTPWRSFDSAPNCSATVSCHTIDTYGNIALLHASGPCLKDRACWNGTDAFSVLTTPNVIFHSLF